MIKNHLAKLQAHPRYGSAHKFAFIEANMSYIGADQVADWCYPHQPLSVESRDPSPRGRVGVWTGPFEKEAYAWRLRDIVEEDALYFAADLIGENAEKDKATLLSQMRKFRMERMEPKDVTFGKFKYAYSGKTSGGEKDDLVLSLMIAIHWGDRKRDEVQFRAWAKERGYRLH